MPPSTRTAIAGPGARYTRLNASGISDRENPIDSRRKMNLKTVNSVTAKARSENQGTQTLGEGSVDSVTSGIVRNSAARHDCQKDGEQLQRDARGWNPPRQTRRTYSPLDHSDRDCSTLIEWSSHGAPNTGTPVDVPRDLSTQGTLTLNDQVRAARHQPQERRNERWTRMESVALVMLYSIHRCSRGALGDHRTPARRLSDP